MSIYYTNSYERSFGTYPLKGEELKKAITTALEVGYRAFDTAQMYQNEKDLGEIINESSLKKELCITTKVHPDNFSKERFIPSVEKSLEDLKLDQVDVLLLHWPAKSSDNSLSLELLQEAYDKKLAKNIGVSNYTVNMLKEAKKILSTEIATNQVEFHPLLDQSLLLSESAKMGVPLSSYCSIARGKVLNNNALQSLAQKYKKSVGQITLRWILQKGVSTNTMSRNPKNIADNFAVMDFTLAAQDMLLIDQQNAENYRIVNNDISPVKVDWD